MLIEFDLLYRDFEYFCSPGVEPNSSIFQNNSLHFIKVVTSIDVCFQDTEQRVDCNLVMLVL